MNLTCNKCSEFGLSFRATHIKPTDYLEGERNADIWIIGLNPKGEIDHLEERTIEEFEKFRPNSSDRNHSYFNDFSKVSAKLYANFTDEKKSRIAHTDLIKCFSPSFPPDIKGPDGQQKKVNIESVIQNCSKHLIRQLIEFKPKVIICNGSPVSREILKIFPPETNENLNTITSYQTTLKDTDHKFWIVLSGFIGRIDDRNKRRLGKEIESILSELKIEL